MVLHPRHLRCGGKSDVSEPHRAVSLRHSPAAPARGTRGPGGGRPGGSAGHGAGGCRGPSGGAGGSAETQRDPAGASRVGRPRRAARNPPRPSSLPRAPSAAILYIATVAGAGRHLVYSNSCRGRPPCCV